MYARFWKRVLDCILSFTALCVLSPVLLVLTALGAMVMGGNPFFLHRRPGKDEVIFPLIKFRTMTDARDTQGNLLPDEQRITRYGTWLRSTSLDELPELINIFLGHMSIIGPRPLLVRYLPLYNQEQKQRHSVRPGLTGLAQVKGRNALSWQEKFCYDVEYTKRVTLWGDIRILLDTVLIVLKREGISSDTSVTMEEFTGNPIEEEATL